MLNFQVICVCQVLNMEELLYLLHAICRQVDNLILLIDNEITCLFLNNAHNRIHFGKFRHILASHHLPCQDVACFIEAGRLAALPRNNQGRPGFVNQYRVHLINNGIMQIPLYKLLLINYHIITKVIKTQLIVRHIRDITGICRTALVVVHGIKHNAYRQAQKLMNLPHPFRITVCQIIIDRYNMDALALQCIEVSRQGRYQRLTFPCLHFSDTPLMQDHAADELHPVMLHAKRPPGSLPHGRICLWENLVQGRPFLQAFLKLLCLAL